MTDFFNGQGDLILSVQGFALIFLAVVCALMGRNVRSPLAWSWLGAFAFIAGLSRWMELLTPFFQGHRFFADGVWLLRLLALISLLEFGRRSWPVRYPKLLLWFYGTLVLIAVALGGLGDRHILQTGTLLVLTLLGGGWAAAALRRAAAPGLVVGGALWMTLSGGLLILFLLTAFALAPPAQAWQLLGTTCGLRWLQQGAPLLLGPVVALLLFLVLHAAHPKNTASYFLVSLPFLAAALTAGWSLTNLIASSEDADKRVQLLSRAKTAATALDHRLLAQLTGTAADTNSPAYADIRERLRAVRLNNADMRRVFLLVRRGSDVVYLAGSELETSKAYVLPGKLYEEASPEMRRVLRSGGAFLEGPLEDLRGVWMSGFASVRTDKNLPLALLGMDVAVSAWQTSIYYHRLSALGLTLFVSLLLLTLFAGLQVDKESAREIASSEGRFRALFESAPEAVFVFEAETGRILSTNPFAARWLGYAPDALNAKSMVDLMLAEGYATLQAALQAGNSGTLDGIFHKQDGTAVNVEITQTSTRLHDRTAVLAYVRDVTVRKQSEEQLRKTMAELERFNRLMVGRELRVIELKREVNDLRRAAGQPPAYVSVERAGGPQGGRPA